MQNKIVLAAAFSPGDEVVEIGSGRGEITGRIAREAGKVYALEIDRSLCAVLRNGLAQYPNIEVINLDVLKFDFKALAEKTGQKLKVIGNIPYYITTPIIERLIEFKESLGAIFLTVQKEFAGRITACPGSKAYGSFSCFVQYYTSARIAFDIPKTCFSPPPKVDSCLLALKVRAFPAVKVKDETLFFKIIRAAFNQRRKTLRNSLAEVLTREKLEAFFDTYRIDPKVRPERLSLDDFANLANAQ